MKKIRTVLKYSIILITVAFFHACDSESVSPKIVAQDSTSHDIIWEVDSLGGFLGSPDAIWGTSDNDIWLTGRYYDPSGNGTNIIHFDGEKWEGTDYFEADLNAVFGNDKNNIWAVGSNLVVSVFDALVAHYDGTIWKTEKIFPGVPSLTSVWVSPSNEVFAAGIEGTIIHFDGNKWELMDSGTKMNLVDVWGFSNEDVYVCGGDINNANGPDVPILLHYNGISWETVYDTVNRENNHFDSIWGTSTDDLFFSATFGVYQGSNATSWVHHSPPRDHTAIKKLRGSSDYNVFILGHYGLLLHYNGKTWFRYDEFFKKPQSLYPEPYYDFDDIFVFENSVIITGAEISNGSGQCVVYKGTITH